MIDTANDLVAQDGIDVHAIRVKQRSGRFVVPFGLDALHFSKQFSRAVTKSRDVGDHVVGLAVALAHVEDARPFGLVPTEPDGRVREFREKPTEPVPGDINAGTYVLDPDVLG